MLDSVSRFFALAFAGLLSVLYSSPCFAALDLTTVTIDMTPFETIAKLVLVALAGWLAFKFCKRAFG